VVLERRGSETDAILYGCLKATNKLVKLDEAYDDQVESSYAYQHVRLRGRFVAWSYSGYDVSCKADCPPGYDPTHVGVSVRGLGRRSTRSIGVDADAIPRVVVSRRGAVAWSQRSGDEIDVAARDRKGLRTLDSGGTEIAPRSLRIRRNTLSWKHGTERRTARLGRY